MSKEPKTAEQTNIPLTGSISKTEIFNYDQCEGCKANIRQQVIEEIEKHAPCFTTNDCERVGNLKDCLGYINCDARNHCLWFWWQQFKGSK
ncbi:MAG: hypothetical protein MUP81_00160 [Dehalococcoidia bacterium]|nr:hypothetical protein [Dehalococcoidia bacterium]